MLRFANSELKQLLVGMARLNTILNHSLAFYLLTCLLNALIVTVHVHLCLFSFHLVQESIHIIS